MCSSDLAIGMPVHMYMCRVIASATAAGGRSARQVDYSITVVSHQEVAAVCIDAIAHHVGAKTARKDTD